MRRWQQRLAWEGLLGIEVVPPAGAAAAEGEEEY